MYVPAFFIFFVSLRFRLIFFFFYSYCYFINEYLDERSMGSTSSYGYTVCMHFSSHENMYYASLGGRQIMSKNFYEITNVLNFDAGDRFLRFVCQRIIWQNFDIHFYVIFSIAMLKIWH